MFGLLRKKKPVVETKTVASKPVVRATTVHHSPWPSSSYREPETDNSLLNTVIAAEITSSIFDSSSSSYDSTPSFDSTPSNDFTSGGDSGGGGASGDW